MGGQMQGQQPQRGTYEEALRPRAMQVGGLFGNPQIAAMIQGLLQSGALQQGVGGFAQAPGGAPSMNVPTFQGPGGTLFDVGTLPPQLQTEPVQPGQVAAPGTAPPSIQPDVRAPGGPVQPPMPAPMLPPPPPSVAPAPGGAYGGINMPQWIAQIIGELTGGGPQGPQAGGPQGPQGPQVGGGGGQGIQIGMDLIGDPTGGAGLFDNEGGYGEGDINPFEGLGPGQVGG